MEPRVRPARASDVDAVHAMQVEWEREGVTIGFVAASPDELVARLGGYFVVAEVGGELAGFAYGVVRACGGEAIWDPGDDAYFELEDIYVRAGQRSLGLGSELFRHLEARLREAGVTRTKVYSATRDLQRVVRFYERLGLSPWSVTMFR